MNSIEHGRRDDQDEPMIVTMKVTENEGCIEFEYLDNGTGIDAEGRQQIFDPFYTTARHKGNIGLGMHLTYNLATQIMNGSISCLENDIGARFVMTFPLKEEEPEEVLVKEPA